MLDLDATLGVLGVGLEQAETAGLKRIQCADDMAEGDQLVAVVDP